jgi:hypothetical protein
MKYNLKIRLDTGVSSKQFIFSKIEIFIELIQLKSLFTNVVMYKLIVLHLYFQKLKA